jgi:voltage-gated sodium channel
MSAGPRERLRDWLQQPKVQNGVLALIVVNAVILGMETSAVLMGRVGPLLETLDSLILAVFVIEIALRVLVHRGAFFRDPWSLLDITVVSISLLPAGGPFAVLRALRVLRVLRILTVAPSMRRVVGGLLKAIPGMSSIAAVMVLLFYVAAVIATHLFASEFPDWFGTIGHSLYSLFQIMTLESWSMGIVRPVMQVYPYAWAFFVPFILMATFTMLNLVIGVIVGAMQNFTEAEEAEQAATAARAAAAAAPETVGPAAGARDTTDATAAHPVADADLHAALRRLGDEVAALRSQLKERADR